MIILFLMMGIGDWGLGIAIPNPQSPIPISSILINFKIQINLINIKKNIIVIVSNLPFNKIN